MQEHRDEKPNMAISKSIYSTTQSTLIQRESRLQPQQNGYEAEKYMRGQKNFLDSLAPSSGQIVETAPNRWTELRTEKYSQSVFTSLSLGTKLTPRARSNAKQLVDEMQADAHPQAPRPSDWGFVTTLCHGLSEALHNSGAKGVQAQDERWHVKYWIPFVTVNNMPVWLDMPVDTAEDRKREARTLALYFMYVASVIKPRSKTDAAAKPKSILQVVLGLKRQHKKRGSPFSMGSGAMMSTALDGIKRLYLETHGADALKPKRKEPFVGDLLDRLLALRQAIHLKAGSTNIQDNVFCRNFFRLLSVQKQAGFRKAEVSVPNHADFGTHNLSRAHLTWHIAEVGPGILDNPSVAQIQRLRQGDYAMIKPPILKNDQFGEKYGDFPIYIYWDITEPNNAGVALAEIEEEFPVADRLSRAKIPLFCSSISRSSQDGQEWDAKPFNHSTLANTLKNLLVFLVGVTAATCYSFHSFRIDLACRLLHNNESAGTIQRMCRWESLDSLKIYARLDSAPCIKALRDASSVRLSQKQVKQTHPRLPQLGP